MTDPELNTGLDPEGRADMFQAALDAIGAHTAVLDTEGRILAVNAAWRAFAGLNELAWKQYGIGANYLVVCDAVKGDCAGQAEKMAQGIRSVARGEQTEFRMEYDCSSPTQDRTFQARVSRFASRGREFVLVSHENVSEVVLEQRRLIDRLEKLAHAQRVKTMGELSSAMAHELNQPLTAISNYLGGCTRRLKAGEPCPADVIEALELVASEARRGGEIIRRMRAFVSGIKTPRSDVLVSDLVGDCVTLLRSMARSEGVTVRAVVPEDVPRTRVDPVQIQQVVINLLRNGIEAARRPGGAAGGTVHVRVSAAERGWITVSVTDNGVGLSAAEAGKLFEPFYTTKADGVGLGLVISRTIVESHRGKIWAKPNASGEGLEVSFMLPAIDEQETSHAA